MSLLQNLYRYRQKESKHNQENFLTEVLAYTLMHDNLFRMNFLSTFLGINDEQVAGVRVFTQESYEIPSTKKNIARPDIVIEIYNDLNCETLSGLVFIENKIASLEGNRLNHELDNDRKYWSTQLSNYDDVLSSYEQVLLKHRYLVYLTKNIELVDASRFKNVFKQIFWHEVYQKVLSKEPNNPLNSTFQFKQYLIHLGMNNNNRFSLQDIIALQNIGTLIQNMDQVLNYVRGLAYKELDIDLGRSKTGPRATFLRDNGGYSDYRNTGVYTLHIGFSPGYDGVLPHAYIWLLLNNKESTNVTWKKIVKKLSSGWHYDEDEVTISKSYLLTDLLSQEDEHVTILNIFFKEAIDELSKQKALLEELR